MSPTITRNVLSGPRPSGLPVARAIAPRLTEAHEDSPEPPESHEPESCLDQMIADLGPASSYKPPHLQRQDRPPPTHFHPSRALPAKPAPKPVTRRKVEPPPPPEGALLTCKEAAEKIIKALLIAAAVAAPRSHDIEMLSFARLTEWLTASRYPDLGGGLGEEIGDVDMLAAVKAFRQEVAGLGPT